MDIKVKDKVNQRHVGRNLQRIRVYLGMKQEALASDLGVSQQEISKIEKQDEIEDGLLTKIAEVLGISTDVIKDFDVEKAICNINNYKDATISPGATATVYHVHRFQQILRKVTLLEEEWIESMDDFFAEAARTVKVGGSLIMFMSLIKIETIIKLAEKHGFYYKTTGIWHKLNPMPRNMNLHFINSTEAWLYFVYKKHTGTFNNDGKAIHDFFETSVTPTGERKFGKHPTQKPLALMSQFVRLLSNENDTVMDPFMGSGSSGEAALILKRNFIGSEINADYFQISNERLSLHGEQKNEL